MIEGRADRGGGEGEGGKREEQRSWCGLKVEVYGEVNGMSCFEVTYLPLPPGSATLRVNWSSHMYAS